METIHITPAGQGEHLLFGPDLTTIAHPRRIYNPVQKDYATFLETSAETNGLRTLIEIELAPGGGNLVHYHKALS